MRNILLNTDFEQDDMIIHVDGKSFSDCVITFIYNDLDEDFLIKVWLRCYEVINYEGCIYLSKRVLGWLDDSKVIIESSYRNS